MGELRGLVEEEVLDHDQVHGGERLGDVLGVGIGLGDVLALDEHTPERAIDGRTEHVGDAEARLLDQRHPPTVLEDRAHGRIGDVAITGELVGEGSHVARALDVVLAA